MFFTLVSYGQIISTGFETGLPAGWVITNNGNGVITPWVVDNVAQSANSGSSSLRVAPETTTVAAPIQDWLILPVANLNGIVNPKVSFYGKTLAGPSRNSKLEVRVSTTNTNLTSFTTIATYNDYIGVGANPISSPLSTYGFHEISLLPYVGQNIYVAFVMVNEGVGKTWWLDDISLFEDCPDATNLAIGDLLPDGGTATWTNPGGAPAFQVEVVANTATPTGVPTYTTTTTTTSQLITGLQPNSLYKYYVRSVCANNVYGDWVGPFAFETNPNPIPLPYSEGFEALHGWRYSNGTQVNKWVVGTATQNAGTKALYISNNDGVSNGYTISSTSITHAYRDVVIPAGVDEIVFSFDFRGQGQSTVDFMRLLSVPSNFTPTAGAAVDPAIGNVIEDLANLTPNYTNKSYIVNVTAYAGTTRRFVFEWRNNSTIGVQPPAAVDNVNITAIMCSAPSNLVLNSTTGTTANISWTAPFTAPASYEYYVSQTNTPPTDQTAATGTSTTTSATVSNLLPGSTNYIWVRSNCGANGKSFWIGYIVVLTNQIPQTLPFSEGFEGTHGFQFTNNLQTNFWMVGAAASNGGTKSLYITNNGQINSYTLTAASAVTAFREITIPNNTTEINVQFDYRGMGQTNLDRMRVWIVPSTFMPTPGTAMTTGNSGGIQVGLTNYVNFAGWTTFNNVVNVTAIAGTNRKIVFEWVNNATQGDQTPAAIDNIFINAITCVAPSNIVLNSVSTNDASLSWTAPTTTNVASYDYYLSTTNTTPLATDAPTGNVTGTTAALSQLATATQYYFWVRSNCGATDGNSFWVGPFAFSTTQIPAQFPYYENFDSSNFVFGTSNGNQSNKWMVGTSTAFSPTKSLYISNDNNSYAYTVTSQSTVHAFRDIQIPAGVSQAHLNFVLKSVGETNDNVKVWIVPVTYNLTPGTVITDVTSGGYQVAGPISQASIYQAFNYQFTLPAALTNQTVKLVFEWTNNATGGAQPPASIDNITFKATTCLAPTNISAGVTCADATIASIVWTPGGTETSWEYLVLPANAPTPSNGNVVTEPMATFPGLLPSTEYVVWVRAICGGTNGNSPWVSKVFNTAASPVAQANPFCAGPEGIVFDNVYRDQGVPNLVPGASFHCLGSTPNPVWYYLQVDGSGQLNFQIVQNTQFNAQGQPVGNTLDVDYIAFGPFDNLNEACSDIIIAPGAPNNPSKIVGCSFSGAAVENFTIPNAQAGQIYALLITNYNGAQGQIKLVQTNAGQPGAGNTDCNFLCEVDLGPDRVICGNETEITGQISTVGGGNVTSIEWFFNGDLMDPNIYNTLNITVNQSGTYSVSIEKENCLLGEPIVDEVEISFISAFGGDIPETLTVCDLNNDGQEEFDLQQFSDAFINGQAGYLVTYHDNVIDANSGFGVLQSPYLSSPKTIFVRIANTSGPTCARVQELELILKETVVPVVDFEYPAPICVNGQSYVSPILVPDFTMGGTFSSSTGLVIDQNTGEIDLDLSKSGLYEVEYFFPVDDTKCGDSDSSTFEIRILDRIGFIIDGYCKEEMFTISATDILGTLDFSTATFKWSNEVLSSEGPIATVDKPGKYSLTVTTADGCVETVEVDITDIYCQIQKGISPNGDGLNDSFVLRNLNAQKVQIFNRYGKEVYSHGSGYTNQWQGQSNNGDALPSGTYFYTIVTPFENFTGWIQLTREIN